MTKTMQQLWDYALFLLFSGGETKDYIHRTACIMKYGAVRKFSPLALYFASHKYEHYHKTIVTY